MIEGKEDEDFKNIWEPSKDENAFYKEMRDLVNKHSVDAVLPNAEEVKKDNYILFPRLADGSYELMVSNTPGKSLRGLDTKFDDELDKLADTFPNLLKERQFSKEQYKLSGLFRTPGKNTLVQAALFPGPCEFKMKSSNLLDESQSVLVGLLIQYKGPYICPITKKEYFGKPYFYDHLKDIDDYIYAIHSVIIDLYKNSFLYKDENEYSCIPFSDLLRLEKEFRKRWSKFTKKRKSPDKYDRSRRARYRLKYRCAKINELIKDYKYYFYLKYLRELFVKNKGNTIHSERIW